MWGRGRNLKRGKGRGKIVGLNRGFKKGVRVKRLWVMALLWN